MLKDLVSCVVWLCASAALGAEPGLMAYYTCDEGSGTTLKDRSGNASDGVIRGAQYVLSGGRHCLACDGVDDYVDCGNPSSLDLRHRDPP